MNPLLSLQAELRASHMRPAIPTWPSFAESTRECGPYDHGIDAAHPLMASVPSCRAVAKKREKIKPWPLLASWLAAETVLAKSGEGKPMR